MGNGFLEFFFNHLWAPILAVGGYLWKQSRDEVQAISKKLDDHIEDANKNFVPNATFEATVKRIEKDFEYVRNGIDDIKDYLLKKK